MRIIKKYGIDTPYKEQKDQYIASRNKEFIDHTENELIQPQRNKELVSDVLEHQKDTYIIKGNAGSIQPTKESTVHTIEALYITHKHIQRIDTGK